MHTLLHNPHVKTVAILLFLGSTLRILLFSGFVLGDDFAYALHASQIINGSYPDVGTHGVFAGRPLLLYPISFSIWMFGWQEWSFILPIFVASLANIVIVYTAGNLLCNALAGTLAAPERLRAP